MRHQLHRTILAKALLLFAALAPAAKGQSTVDFPPVSKNAALQYWQAFAMLPALDAEQEKLLDNRATAPLDETANKLLDQSHASLMFLHRGARLRKCDWGLDYRDGASMYLPHLVKARTLSRLAALDARRGFEARQYDRGRDDVFGMVALARQVGSDHTLVSMLVCYAIEGMAVDAVAPYLPELGASYEKSVSMFQSLPPSPPLKHGVECERRLASAIINQLKEVEKRQPGSWRGSWKAFLGEGVPDPVTNVDTLGELVRLMDGFQNVYDQLSELVVLPPREFDEKYPEFVKRAESANPFAKILLPAMDKVVTAQRRSEARMAMLLAAIAVVEGGPDKLAAIKDPFGDGPFEYRKLDTGFQLSSKLLEKGEPVTLIVGQK